MSRILCSGASRSADNRKLTIATSPAFAGEQPPFNVPVDAIAPFAIEGRFTSELNQQRLEEGTAAMSTLRAQARTLMWLVTIPLVALCLLAAVLIGNIVWHGGRFADVVAIYYLPMALYIWAIWMVRQALAAVARGDMFDAVVPTLLSRVGLALFGGAVFTVVGTPLLWRLAYGHDLARPFEASSVALGVIGLTLVLVARLLRRAADMRDELREFF
jgi:hypothetical protein